MNINILDKKTDLAFSGALQESDSVQNWLTQRLTGYNNIDGYVSTLHISIDTFTPPARLSPDNDQEYYSFNWCIVANEIDPVYGDKIKNGKEKTIINGGLIFRGIESIKKRDQYGNRTVSDQPVYSSHT